MTIFLAVGAAIGWGASDFFGGFARRETPVFVLLAVSQLIGLLVLVPVLIIHGVPPPGSPRLLLACAAGLGVTLELRFVYVAISGGQAFITPAVGALGTLMAVIVGLIGGDPLNLGIAVGMPCALLGGGLSAWTSHPDGHRHDRASARSAAATCAGGAAGVSIMLISLHAAGRVDPYWAATLVDLSTLIAAAVAVATGRRRLTRRQLPRRAQLPALGLCSAAGAAGDLAYAAASQQVSLTIVAALASLYPLATIALGITVESRRLGRLQAIGIALALAGAALLGVAGR